MYREIICRAGLSPNLSKIQQELTELGRFDEQKQIITKKRIAGSGVKYINKSDVFTLYT